MDTGTDEVSRRDVLARAGVGAGALALAGTGRGAPAEEGAPGGLRAGASIVDISPTHFPAIVSGGFLERRAAGLRDKLHARALSPEEIGAHFRAAGS